MKSEFTLTIYSEDQIRLITRLSSMFLRKQIQILSLNISICEMDTMYRHTIVVNETLDHVINLVAQIEKIIEVYKCYYHLNEEIVFRQLVLFKIPTAAFVSNLNMEFMLWKNDFKIAEIQKEYIILEAIGTDDEIVGLTEKLSALGLIEFVKSSRIALVKCKEGFCIEM